MNYKTQEHSVNPGHKWLKMWQELWRILDKPDEEKCWNAYYQLDEDHPMRELEKEFDLNETVERARESGFPDKRLV